MTNPYAPPRANVIDVADPSLTGAQADRGPRLGASILDGIIFSGMVYVPLMIGLFVGAAVADATGEQNAALPLAGVGLALVGFAIWAWLTIKYVLANGQSIGKKILNIKVVRSDGSPCSFARLFWLRNVVNGLLSVIPLYGLVDVLFIFSETRQCLHDKIADTIVVKA